ncbi:MAG: 4Fe-4S dicluster domain-containing protein [Thermodesulfobacteriota bacterium]|nr:4Fe-4S dicluster domain-containing protein [Thermodesulfobacteriota bacterium]
MLEKLKEIATQLFEEETIDTFIGYAQGSLHFKTTPLITQNKDDIERLVLNPFIYNNLSVFLKELPGKKIGIVVKGCDSRSLVSLIQDNQIERNNLIIIGIPCDGLIDLTKLEDKTSCERWKFTNITRDGDSVRCVIDDSAKEFLIEDILCDKCLACPLPTPKECDMLLGDERAPKKDIERSLTLMRRIENMEYDDRWNFWKAEFKKCIRCYACRSICPACSCDRCFVDINMPQWLLPASTWDDNLIFQFMRNIHIAGRCSDCGECERACPVNIPLRTLARNLNEEILSLYNFEVGMDIEDKPLLSHFDYEDPEDFIL